MTNSRRTFTLNNSLAAVSAVPLEDTTLATDGNNCKIHVFEADGRYSECIQTVRAYSRLRRDGQSDSFTALGCCNSTNVYFIDENYNENASVLLDAPCDCNNSGINGLTDAMLTCVDGERFILGAFAQGAYLFDMNGERLSVLCASEQNEILTDFITFGEDRYAYSTLCGNTRTVTVSDNRTVLSSNLERDYTLRMLFAYDDTVYGLFGRNYLYNHIIPIYSNGRLILPRGIENSCFTC